MDLDLFGRHLVLGPAVHTGNIVTAQPDGGPQTVHGGVTATYDNGLAGVFTAPAVQGNLLQELNAAQGQILTLDAGGGRGPAADRYGNCIIFTLEFIQLDILTHLLVTEDLDAAHLGKVGDFLIKDLLGQTVLRDTVAQHTAGLGHHIVEVRSNPFPSQKIGYGQTGRTGTHDGNLLAAQGFAVLHVLVIMQIGRQTLEVVDGHRFVHYIAAAVLFAETRADPAD